MQRNIDVYSVQIAQWRKVPDSINFFDITVKSGAAAFAPVAKYLWLIKKGEISEEDYDYLYCTAMEERIAKHPEYYRETLLALVEEKDAIAFACYCGRGKFCHRMILIQKVLPKMSKVLDLSFTYKGEIPL